MTYQEFTAQFPDPAKCPLCGSRMSIAESLIPNCSKGCTPNDIIIRVFRPAPTPEEALNIYAGHIFTTKLLRQALDDFKIGIRKNEISGDIDLSGIPDSWSKENAPNNLPVMLLDIFKSAMVKGATKNAVCDALEVISDEKRYNPVRELLQPVAWDEVDRMPIVCEILGIADTFSMQLIWKWLQQGVAMAFNSAVHPCGADGVLVLQGAQGIGKTSFFRKITPIPSLFKEGAELDPKNKDSIIQSTSCWICELGELERTTKRDQAALKAIITADFDHYREPYARKAVKKPRRTSFCATVNPGSFLPDDTGNRRWWTVPVEKIDLERLFSLSPDFVLQLWVQAYDEWRENPQGFRLSGSERQWLDTVNRAFEKPLRCELEVRAILNYNLPVEQWSLLTPAEVAKKMLPIPPAENVGRVLAKLAREDTRITQRRVSKGVQYLLPLTPTYTM